MGLEGHDHDVGIKMCQCSVYSILYSNILYIYIYCIILNYVSAILCVYIFLLYSIDFNEQEQNMIHLDVLFNDLM